MATRYERWHDTADPARTVGRLIVRLRGEGLLAAEDVDRILRTAIATATTADATTSATRRPKNGAIATFLGAMHDGYVNGEPDFAY